MEEVAWPWVIGVTGAIVLGSTIQTITGIGFALVVTPILLIGLPAHQAILTGMILHSFLCLMLVASHLRYISSLTIPVLGGALVGTPIGVAVFSHLNQRVEVLTVSSLLLVTGLPLLAGVRMRISAETVGSAIVGATTGFLNGTSGLSGPPLAVYIENQGWNRLTARACLWTTFLASNITALSCAIALGQMSKTSWLVAIRFAPALVVGFAAVRLSPLSAREWLLARGAALVAWIAVISGLVGFASVFMGSTT